MDWWTLRGMTRDADRPSGLLKKPRSIGGQYAHRRLVASQVCLGKQIETGLLLTNGMIVQTPRGSHVCHQLQYVK